MQNIICKTIFKQVTGVLLAILLVIQSIALLTPSVVYAADGEEKSVITTDEIMNAAFESQDCLNYCLVGVCLWLVCSYYECHVEWSIKIRHYNPELVVSAFPRTGENPWDTVNDIVGEDNQELSDDIAADMGAFFSSGGQNHEGQHADEHRNVIHKDAEAFGHPLATVINMYAGGDVIDSENLFASFVGLDNSDPDTGEEGSGYTFDVPADNEEANSTEDTLNSESSEDEPFGEALDGIFDNVFSELESVMDEDLGDAGGDFGVATGEGGYLCPHRATSFMPYFLAAWDFYGWRFGIPDMFNTAAWIPGEREIQLEDGQTWGAVYPRQGTAIQHSDPKAAAVVSQRAADIVTRDQQGHIYLYLSNERYWPWHWPPGPVEENNILHRWQLLLPEVRDYCELFGQDDRTDVEGWGAEVGVPDDRTYAFALWRRYECCTDPIGAFIGAIDGPPICLTGPDSAGYDDSNGDDGSNNGGSDGGSIFDGIFN